MMITVTLKTTKFTRNKLTETVVFTLLLIDNKLQSSSHLEDPNKINELKTINNHEGELVMAYNNNDSNHKICPRTFYALYIGPNDSGNTHLIFKLSINQILVTMKYKQTHVPEDLINAINETDSFNNKIQTNHFDSDHCIVQDYHFHKYEDDS